MAHNPGLNPQAIPPALAREIQAALAEGRPLPPGVVAVPSGQQPPLGSVPTGINAQMPPGGGLPPKTQHNPLSDGEEGLKIMRAYAQCPIPQEASRLNKMLQALLQNPPTEHDAHIDDILAKGLLAGMRANRYCSSSKTTRTACIFSEDPTLAELHASIQAEEAALDKLSKEVEACVKRGQELLRKRWETAVKTYGLNPDQHFYYIDEEKGRIELVSLNCEVCKGAADIVEARTHAASILSTISPE